MDEKDLLTLYAGLAMQGLVASKKTSPQTIAKYSFDIAEAMIKEQGERNGTARSTQGN